MIEIVEIENVLSQRSLRSLRSLSVRFPYNRSDRGVFLAIVAIPAIIWTPGLSKSMWRNVPSANCFECHAIIAYNMNAKHAWILKVFEKWRFESFSRCCADGECKAPTGNKFGDAAPCKRRKIAIEDNSSETKEMGGANEGWQLFNYETSTYFSSKYNYLFRQRQLYLFPQKK